MVAWTEVERSVWGKNVEVEPAGLADGLEWEPSSST